MRQKIEAVYEDGLLRPLEPLNLADHQRVSVTVEAATELTGLTTMPLNGPGGKASRPFLWN